MARSPNETHTRNSTWNGQEGGQAEPSPQTGQDGQAGAAPTESPDPPAPEEHFAQRRDTSRSAGLGFLGKCECRVFAVKTTDAFPRRKTPNERTCQEHPRLSPPRRRAAPTPGCVALRSSRRTGLPRGIVTRVFAFGRGSRPVFGSRPCHPLMV